MAKPFDLNLWNAPLTLIDKNLNGILIVGLLTVFAYFMAIRAHEVLHEPNAFLLEHNMRVLGAHLVFIILVVYTHTRRLRLQDGLLVRVEHGDFFRFLRPNIHINVIIVCISLLLSWLSDLRQTRENTDLNISITLSFSVVCYGLLYFSTSMTKLIKIC